MWKQKLSLKFIFFATLVWQHWLLKGKDRTGGNENTISLQLFIHGSATQNFSLYFLEYQGGTKVEFDEVLGKSIMKNYVHTP